MRGVKTNVSNRSLPGVQVWNADFFLNKHVKFGRRMKSVLFKECSIACYTFPPSFGQFVNTALVKIFPFCCETFIEPFFHIFVRTKVRDVSMQTSGNRKQANPVSKSHGVELPSWVLPTCREPVLPMWWSIVTKKNDFTLPLLTFFQVGNNSSRSIVVGNCSGNYSIAAD